MPNQNDIEHGVGFPQSLDMKGLTKPTDIAIDWVGRLELHVEEVYSSNNVIVFRNIYWMDVDRSGSKPKGRIFASLLDGRYRKAVINDGLGMPTALAVNPELG